MHSLKFSTDELNLICRALDTLAEQSQVLKENLTAQVGAEQAALAAQADADRVAAEKKAKGKK